MGCDIHAYVEYTEAKPRDDKKYWRCLIQNGGGRDYEMFAVLAGVRGSVEPVVQPRGMPDGELSWEVKEAVYMRVTDDPAQKSWDNYCTRDQAAEWREPVFEINEVEYICAPDYHTHSWLTADELAQVIAKYMFEVGRCYAVEWDAMLAAMRSLEDRGYTARLTFWFDN